MNRHTQLLLLSTILAAPASAQSLPQRVAALKNGTALFAYPTRTGVCGNGHAIFVDDPESPDGHLVYSANEMHTGWTMSLTGGCDAGPAIVRLTLRDMRVVALRPTVGGDEPRTADQDLGRQTGADAAAYLLEVAKAADEEVARHAMFAAMIADSAPIAQRLAGLSRDHSLRPGVRQAALRWLGRTAARDGYAAEATRVMHGIAADSTDVTAVRDRAIREVGRTAGGDQFLRELYFKVSEPALRDRAIRVLGEDPTSATLTWIENIALNENETVALRDRALRTVAEAHQDAARVRTLYPRLHHEALKDRAVRLVGAQGDAASERWLLALAQNATEPQAVRDRAIRMLAESGNYAQLRDLYGRVQDHALKDRIIRVVGEAGGSDNVRFVRGIVASNTESTAARERALKVLAHSGMSSADLAALYDSLPDRSLRSRLIQMLAERGGEPAIDKLAKIAREDSDSELRRQATRRLAQSGDPRAQAYFERTLKN